MSKKRKPPTGEFEIGYKKPPKKTQFKKGKSGNAKGRPKQSRNMVTILNEELDQLITITEDGKNQKVPIRVAIAKRLIHSALNGDMRSTSTLINMDADREDPNATVFEVTEHDKETLNRLLNRLTKERNK